MRSAWLVVLVACAPPARPASSGDAPAALDGAADALWSTDAAPALEGYGGPFFDFPKDPIVDGVPDLTSAFAGPASGDAPCLAEPADGALLPRNWMRPRFEWSASGNVYQVTVRTASEHGALVAFVAKPAWTMPEPIWAKLATHVVDEPIEVEVRSGTWDGAQLWGPSAPAVAHFTIAPVAAPGELVYWTSTGGTSLHGFHLGDETVATLLTPAQTGSGCIGCHVVTPDGAFFAFENNAPTSLAVRATDGTLQPAPFVTPAAQQILSRPEFEWPQFSAQHYTDGDLVMIAEHANADREEVTWIDLQATSQEQGAGWGVLARPNDPRSAATPSFAHTSDAIVYASATAVSPISITDGDLAILPFGNRMGGPVTFVAGASTDEYNEYEPAFSPDDRLLAFARVQTGLYSYANPTGEVDVIPADGGVPQRLAANDWACRSPTAFPGNSWPKWSPRAVDAGGKRYYWLAFTSTRRGAAQLFITPLVDDGGTLRSYPALYPWNQHRDEYNHTPAWFESDVVPATR